MKTFIQKLTVVLLKAISYLPFPILYGISDLFFVVVYYLIGYRKQVVLSNLRHSFPEKTDRELKTIARNYYRHFADLTLETIKMNRMPEKVMRKHIKFINTNRLESVAQQGKGIVLLCMHYNNWEWNSFLAQFINFRLLMVYSPMPSNPYMEKHITTIRKQFGTEDVPMPKAPRAAIQLNDGPPYGLMWLAADQTPPAASQYWTTFLNQETPFFAGPQKIASKTNCAVYFHYVHKVKRGQYVADFIEITSSPATDGEHAVLLDYVDIVEQIIRRKPDYWLWSHRRWKHSRSDNQKLIPRNPVNRFEQQVNDMMDGLNQIKSI